MTAIHLAWSIFWRNTLLAFILSLLIGAIVGLFGILILLSFGYAGLDPEGNKLGVQMSVVWLLTGTMTGMIYGGLTGILAGVLISISSFVAAQLLLGNTLLKKNRRSSYSVTIHTLNIIIIGIISLISCIANPLTVMFTTSWPWLLIVAFVFILAPTALSILVAWITASITVSFLGMDIPR